MDGSVIAWTIGIILFLFFLKSASTTPKSTSRNKSREAPEWLLKRWQSQLNGEPGFPEWYQHEPSERQIQALKQYGIEIPPKLTKGTASDLIGLKLPADEADIEIAKFFKRNHRNLSQTEGREIARQVSNSAELLNAWNNRPPNALTKAQLKHFGIKITKETTQNQAYELLKNHNASEHQWHEWDLIESAYEEFTSPDTKDFYDIKKPTPNQVATAIKAAIKENIDPDDLDEVAEKLIELYPTLEEAK